MYSAFLLVYEAYGGTAAADDGFESDHVYPPWRAAEHLDISVQALLITLALVNLAYALVATHVRRHVDDIAWARISARSTA